MEIVVILHSVEFCKYRMGDDRVSRRENSLIIITVLTAFLLAKEWRVTWYKPMASADSLSTLPLQVSQEVEKLVHPK